MTSINSTSDSVAKKRGRKKAFKEELTVKPLGLFDHVKHIRSIQNPNYYKNLSELDRKSFDINHFMILRSLSMNPALLETISTLFMYFDKIPSPQFYQLLIGLIAPDRRFYPWIKGKKSPFGKRLLELIARYFEISEKEAEEYAALLTTTNHVDELRKICEDFGLESREIEEIFENKNEE